MKTSSKQATPYIWISLAIVVVALATIFTLTSTSTSSATTPQGAVSQLRPRDQLTKICKEYMDVSQASAGWWLMQPAPAGTPELANSLAIAKTNILRNVACAKHASPLASNIASAFPLFMTTQFEKGGSVHTTQGDINPEELKFALEVCFVPQNEFYGRNFPSTLFYRQDWKAVMIGGINWPDPFFAGVLMHELGHAYRHKIGASHQNFTPGWFQEEVDMYDLQGQVFDHLTERRYSQTLDAIYESHASATNVVQFMTFLSSEDLLKLDRVIKIEQSGYEVRGAACTGHAVLLGFTYLEKKGGSAQDKINHYRWFVGK